MTHLIPKLIGIYINSYAFFAPKKAAKASFNIFTTPKGPALKPHQKAFLDTAEQIDFNFQSHKIKAYKWGSGDKKILFLHGWLSHSFRWKKYIELLDKDKYTIYAFDGLAHGQSEGKTFNIPLYQELINAFIDNIGRPYVVVSHSMGGFAALLAFHELPRQSPDKLVIMGSPGLAHDFVKQFEDALNLNQRSRKAMEDYFVETLGRPPEYYDAVEFAKTQKAKGLVIHDIGDEDVPVKFGRLIAKNWPHAIYWETQGFGHKLRDKEVVQRVLDFIND